MADNPSYIKLHDDVALTMTTKREYEAAARLSNSELAAKLVQASFAETSPALKAVYMVAAARLFGDLSQP